MKLNRNDSYVLKTKVGALRTAKVSLKTKLLLQLAIPMLFFMAVESVLSYFVTLHYVNNAYDGWLLDSARSLAQEIKIRDGKVRVELPTAALEIFKWDDQDKTYFKILSANDRLIAGDPLVPDFRNSESIVVDDIYPSWWRKLSHTAPLKPDGAAPIYFNGSM